MSGSAGPATPAEVLLERNVHVLRTSVASRAYGTRRCTVCCRVYDCSRAGGAEELSEWYASMPEPSGTGGPTPAPATPPIRQALLTATRISGS